MARRRVLAAALAPLAALGAGCTRYAPIAVPGALDALPAGAPVRVSLTPAGAAAVAPTVGSAVVGLEGSWLAAPGDSVRLHVSRLLTSAGVPVAWTGGAVSVARADVRAVERRAVSRGRTALLVGGAVALGAAVVQIVRHAGGANGGGGGGGQTPF